MLVLSPGPLTLIEDLGRPGYAAIGVGPSGAADRPALRLANRLVGNDEGAAALEAVLGGLALRFLTAATVAVTGADSPVTVDRCAARSGAPVEVGRGAVLRVGVPGNGLRSYLAVRGGIDVPPVLGSRSTDVLAGLGPAPLAAGDRLAVGPAPVTPAAPAPVAGPPRRWPDPALLLVRPGPRRSLFGPDALAALGRGRYQVSADSNRVGLRLAGPPISTAATAELPSEGLVTGAVQVPPDGQPIVLLADRPVTGGYPVLAVVTAASVAVAAQLRPGRRVELRLDSAG